MISERLVALDPMEIDKEMNTQKKWRLSYELR